MANHPRNTDHPARLAYKSAKSRVCYFLRQQKRAHQEQFYNNLDLASSSPSKLFRIIKQVNCCLPKPTEILHYNNSTYVAEEITEARSSYFSSLASHTLENKTAFTEALDKEYESIKIGCSSKDFDLFTIEELQSCLSSLKPNKAAGLDRIDPEHIIYAGNAALQHLCSILYAIMLSAHIVMSLCCGCIVPIPKGRN